MRYKFTATQKLRIQGLLSNHGNDGNRFKQNLCGKGLKHNYLNAKSFDCINFEITKDSLTCDFDCSCSIIYNGD